jgi:hypothetical protein
LVKEYLAIGLKSQQGIQMGRFIVTPDSAKTTVKGFPTRSILFLLRITDFYGYIIKGE